MEFLLANAEALPDSQPEELARILLSRFGLLPRKRDGQAKMHSLVLELYERKKSANKEKKPELAVCPVETMAMFAGIKRQTMYEYLHRFLDLQILKKTTFVSNGKVVIGYELNGPTMEGAFRKAETVIRNHLDDSFKIIDRLQNEIRKEKISAAVAEKNPSSRLSQDNPSTTKP